MTSLLAPIRARLQLTLRRRASMLDDGEHPANVRGRSLEFEDLREYVPGDDVKDIDWKATARSSHPLVRRYAALRTRQVVFVVDTGRAMRGHARELEPKRDVARTAVGVFALVATGQGDRVLLVHGDAAGSTQSAPGSSAMHVERLLRTVEDAVETTHAPSDLTTQLAFVARRIRRRSLVIVVGDDAGFDSAREQALRRLVIQHDVVWLTVLDLDPADPRVATSPLRDVDMHIDLPQFLRPRGRIAAQLDDARRARREHQRALLSRIGVHEVRLASVDDVVPRMFDLFQQLRRARGRHPA